MARSTTIRSGELTMFSGGEFEETYVAGIFRATSDLDIPTLVEEYGNQAKANPPDINLPGNFPCLMGSASISPARTIGFLDWLERGGHLERVATAHATLGELYVTGKDSKLLVEVDVPDDEAPSPRGP